MKYNLKSALDFLKFQTELSTYKYVKQAKIQFTLSNERLVISYRDKRIFITDELVYSMGDFMGYYLFSHDDMQVMMFITKLMNQMIKHEREYGKYLRS